MSLFQRLLAWARGEEYVRRCALCHHDAEFQFRVRRGLVWLCWHHWVSFSGLAPVKEEE